METKEFEVTLEYSQEIPCNPMRSLYLYYIDSCIDACMRQGDEPDFWSGVGWGFLYSAHTVALNFNIMSPDYTTQGGWTTGDWSYTSNSEEE
jgi:hypothetical protein